TWYLALKAVDFAGNWSSTARLSYSRDTTPPSAVSIEAPQSSADGFIASNTFSITWQTPPEPDVAGFSWVLDYLGPLDRLPARKRPKPTEEAQAGSEAGAYRLEPTEGYELNLWNAKPLAEPAKAIRTSATRADFSNLDDGYWLVAVAAIDNTGNVGPSSRAILRLDKFVPYTAISDVRASRDDFGTLSFSVLGRGFSEDGPVTRIALDNDGREPFERVFELSAGTYRIRSDRLLDGAKAEDLPKGSWRVGIFHPKRGWLFSKPIITVDERGTVKLGPAVPAWKPTWIFQTQPSRFTDLGTVFMYLALILPLAGVILSFRQAALTLAQGASIRRDALALLEGKSMPAKERERAVKAAIRKGAGLTAKFALTISMLVIFVVALVSVPLALQLVRSQSATLASGLSERAEVLLESAVQGGRSYLPSQDDLNLSNIPYQVSAVKGALWMTITGYGKDKSTNPDIVWATNEPDASLKAKLDSDSLSVGSSGLRDSLSPLIATIASELNQKAMAEAGELAAYTQDLRDENVRLSIQLAQKYSADLDARQQELSAQIRGNDTRVRELLAAISDASIASVPPFDPNLLSLDPEEYVFYKPIMYAQGREPVFYRGMVRLAVTTEYIVAAVKDARAALFRSIAIVAAIALAAGVVGSIILSGIIINPIRRLVRGIETIRDTPDKKDLADFTIEIKSKDELQTLANTINDMTMGLVVAAREAEFLTVGKDVQKMFIPLESNAFGEKLTTGRDERASHTFFGYYEGAKGVSGDYFDYRQLDDRYWAFIKCDVSGKGVPAALIMVGVATIFTSEFQSWSYKKNGIKLDELTYRINDFLFRRGFKGRFAAFLMGVYDSKTGTTYLCHAGDKFVYIYSVEKRALIKHELVSVTGDAAPAAGPIDSDLIMMGKAPFTQVTRQLAIGDTLILYTDGFEESNRARRNPDFSEMYELKKTKNADGSESAHKEALLEYLGEERLKEIVEAIMQGRRWTLIKENDPLGPDTRYDFDFSSCTGKPDELVLGLASVEKVFRMVPDPHATEDDMVLVDSKLDAMLERCFVQYATYCRDKIDHPNPRRTEYKYWRHMKEDDQYDDLTMMVIRRNT
ncbi:MAG TPA: SpoIIE family protein phosphatase, partial [Spirochaetales bacterium]|nr:SpoIIE family protein phosphatase [Spirochaetales bacterium]